MKLSSVFKRRCESIAVDWRYQLGLKAFDPLPAEKMLKALNGTAITPEELAGMSQEMMRQLVNHDDWSAGIIRHDPLLILHHSKHSPPRQQSNLMHEIAHILLNHPSIHFDKETGIAIRDARCEDEATYLGGCLQIPKLGLRWAREKGFTVKQVANHFGASEQMVRFRSNMIGIAFDRLLKN